MGYYNRILGSAIGLLLMLAVGCSPRIPFYGKSGLNWTLESPPSDSSITKSIFLLGDAGKSKGKSKLFKFINKEAERLGDKASIVFLGDNIYPSGLPVGEGSKRKKAEKRLLKQIELMKSFPKQAFMVPGNHDWGNKGKSGAALVKEEEKMVQKFLADANSFAPDNGCPGPVYRKINENAGFVFLDLHLFIKQGIKSPDLGEECQCNGFPDFVGKLSRMMDKHSNEIIIVASHYPLVSYGNHGGKFGFRDHVFPLSNFLPGFYLPLPLIGSLYPIIRKAKPPVGDLFSKNYTHVNKNIQNCLSGHNRVIYASGHEHSLQYQSFGNINHVVSGTGSKRSYLKKDNHLDYGQASPGFFRIDLHSDGQVWLTSWQPTLGGEEGLMTYSRQLYW